MTNLTDILKAHAARYPLMQLTDAVKLLYQNEFGGGHMIADETACRAYLHREYAAVQHDDACPLYTDIGNGIVRVNLAALQPQHVDALCGAFIASANSHKGDKARFLAKLDLLRRLTAEGLFSFTERELEDYLAAYAAKDYPPVSHSETFRAAYAPAYRIVLLDLLPDALKNA